MTTELTLTVRSALSYHNLTFQILRKLQIGQSEILERVDDLQTIMILRFAEMNDKLNGQLISEIELREELRQHLERIIHIERRLELTNE